MMGACTSTTRHRSKDYHPLRKPGTSKHSFVLEKKQSTTLPLSLYPSQQHERPHSLITTSDFQSSTSSKEPLLRTIDTNSLIHLYSTNSYRHSWMSSSSAPFNARVPTRIPLLKTRSVTHQVQPLSTETVQTNNCSSTSDTTNQTSITASMSTGNRPPLPSTSQNNTNTQNRFGFISRPIASNSQSIQASPLDERSRSISPSSTLSANSSSTTVSPRATKTSTIPKPTTTSRSLITTQTSKSKITPTTHSTKESPTTKLPTTTRLHPTTSVPAHTSTTSPSSSLPTSNVLHAKADVNVIRDRYKTQQRMTFYTRRSSIPNSLKSSPANKEEKNEQPSTDDQITKPQMNNSSDDLRTEATQPASTSRAGDSAYASVTVPSNPSTSTQNPQMNRPRQRVSSTLSSSSQLSDVLNNDSFLDDENCSLKSDDLMCDYDDTLTIGSVSKNERADSSSSASLSNETNKKTTTPLSKLNNPGFHMAPKEYRSHSIAKCSTSEKVNANLLESLDELTQLSHRMDNFMDNEYQRNRLLTRSITLKAPATSLPPREDGEQIIMDIESYRQVMKDVTVVKTVLHQLDRLLKHSDGTNMTDSMVGSFHESLINSRHFSISSAEGNLRNVIDENSTYDDLVKEIMILRKEREQDKQTIKLLQEQMYKYSSQANAL